MLCLLGLVAQLSSKEHKNILIYLKFYTFFQFAEVDLVHDEILWKKEEQDREKPYRHLFRFPHMGMWTKLRPGIWNFLEKVIAHSLIFLTRYSCFLGLV